VKKLVFEDENVYVKARSHGLEPASVIREAAERELSVFNRLAELSVDDFKNYLGAEYLPPFESHSCDLALEYELRIKDAAKHGYGIFASHPMFRLDGSRLVPIGSADKSSISDFVGYEQERGRVIENTLAFLAGKPALNVLLYGDAGTGKSSTVKACVNEYFSEGLRLIELRKDQLDFLPEIMARISDNPLKFIIFIDDLSFNKSDDNFSMLKAALEGSASARSDNALIYATSNRRHIVRETFDEREGAEVHRNDAMQEKLSLSERFGLSVLFARPNKQLYLDIVHTLAERNGLDLPESELDILAEEFALRRGTRSARCAEQFVKSLL
jgi:predicted AAA+ superfamily ATPase